MSRPVVITLAVVIAAVIAVAVKVGTGSLPVRLDQSSTPDSASPSPSAPKPSSTAPTTSAAPTPPPDTIKVERDPATVFQRSFWRRLGDDVRVVGAERREWLERGTSVQKWEWFIALDTKPEFRRWLLEQNPFELTRKTTPGQVTHASTDAPSWFPSADKLTALTIYSNHEGRFLVFLDEKTGRLFATDRGGGFAPAAQPLK